MIPGVTWAAGFVLGAIVSPPDAAAATAITRGLRLPRRVVQIIEGESLVNDAAALTVYRFAVAAVVTGAFSMGEAALSFVWITAGGIGVGLLCGFGYVKLFPRIKDPEAEILSTFLQAYAAYVAAEALHASGVLAVVTAGLILGWHGPKLFSANVRIRGTAVWQSAIFFVNSLTFLLIGLQLPRVIRALERYTAQDLLLWSGMVSALVILARVAWMYPAAYIPRWLFRSVRESEARPSPQGVTVVAWTGLRGVVSLAAALSLPETFPHRDVFLLLTFAVILSTLVVQGLTLRPLIRWLKLPEDFSSEEEQLEARVHAVEQALRRLGELEETQAAPPGVLNRVRGFFEDRLADLKAQLEVECGEAQDTAAPERFQTVAEQRVWWELARVERSAILELRRTGRLGDEAMREIEREIDLLEARIVPQR
jgi:CPA1 family monovalent cation:H+ antiporter